MVTTAFFAGGYPWQPSLTDARKAWFLMALSKLGWNDWTVLNDQDVVALERRTADGKTLLAVFNTNFDEMEAVRLRAPYVPQTVEVLAPGGIWRRVAANAASGELVLPIRLPCSHACIVRMSPQRQNKQQGE